MTLERRSSMREILRLAWPSALSYLFNNTYRINDEFWIQGLGAPAQAAFTAILFVSVMNFALIVLAAAGTLSLTARATGAGDARGRDRIIAHALWIGLAVWILFATIGPMITPSIVRFLELPEPAAGFAREYLSSLYVVSLPLVLAPAIDHAFIGVGNTLIPSLLEIFAVVLNYFLAPAMIYGVHAAERIDHPGVGIATALAKLLGLEGFGMRGAPLAIAASRLISVSLGLAALRRFFDVRWYRALRPRPEIFQRMLAIAVPVSLSVALYSGVYWALIKLVMVPLVPEGVDNPALAALGLGLSVFEGVTFPCFLGVAMAGASLVGRAIGALDERAALEAVSSSRKLALLVGVAALVVFVTIAREVAPHFSTDAGVVRETIGYVTAIAFSQVFVAQEAANEKILLGAGYTTPAMWVSMLGNALRVPLAWLFAIRFGFAAVGVWWAINATSVLKAALQFRLVEQRTWLVRGLEHQRRSHPIDA